MSTPKWATRERQEQLVQLWHKYGTTCLQGHPLCPTRDHYVYWQSIVTIGNPIRLACHDGHGNPIRDRNGNLQYLVVGYRPKADRVPHTARLYEKREAELIADWIAEDRATRAYERKVLSRALHKIPERGSIRGTFNAISRTIYHDSQPQFYIEAVGISGLAIRPFAKVRIASSFTRLHVDLGDSLVRMSKHRKRKAIRYGKALPPDVQKDIDTRCGKAVAHYLNS